jgi:hypothetical protein
MNHLILKLLLVAATATVASANNHYVRDDGIADSSIGYGIPQDYCWMQWFATVGAVDTITQIEAYIPSTTPVGTPITFCVWDDPNDDWDPIDATLVAMSHTTVQYHGPNAFVSYPLPAPGLVHGVFFVGAFLTETGSLGPAALDYSTNPHVAYYSFSAARTFDPVNLSNNFPPTHIETIGAGIHGVFMLRATGSGDTPTTYCTAKTNSLGCAPSIGFLGVPSATAGSGFLLTATNVMNRRRGLLFYGTSGRSNAPFLGGTLCVQPPLFRISLLNSGGSAVGNDCTGIYYFDFNVRIAAGFDPLLVPGRTVQAQFYSIDPGFTPPEDVGLTNAIEFTIAP